MIETEIRNKYQVVIGLEVHAQLLTKSKIFASDLAEFGNLPNTNISVITLGHPGVLPKLNKKAVEFAIKMGLACGSSITKHNVFARKNYFYPDLPKGYQITQDKTPICVGGTVIVKADGKEKLIGITRIHMEEDAGKSMHLAGETDTLVDYNRAGTPLIEIVSEPDMRTSEEAQQYLTEIRKMVRYLDVCDGNMEEGSMRCDVNISVMLKSATQFGTKVEIKNMNSIRNVQRAIEYEIERQIEKVENGEIIPQETRNFDATDGKTYSMRMKETMNDYRYFPEPDLTPLVISQEWLESIKISLPALPRELHLKFVNEYKLPEYDAMVLTDVKETALYFEEICKHTKNYKAAANWLMGPVKSYLNERSMHLEELPLKPEQIADIIALIDSGKTNFAVASQNILPVMIENKSDRTALQIADSLNLVQDSNVDTIQLLVEEVLNSMPSEVEKFKNGKLNLLGVFVGEVIKRSKGKADPKVANELLRKALAK